MMIFIRRATQIILTLMIVFLFGVDFFTDVEIPAGLFFELVVLIFLVTIVGKLDERD